MPPEGTRERILAAAMAEFAEKTFAGATTRGIAARAGVNEVTLFRHFKTKQELLEATIAAQDVSALRTSLYAGLEELPTREALLLLAQRWHEFLTHRLDLIRLRLVDQIRTPDIPRPATPGFRTRLANLLKERQARGELRSDADLYLAAESFFGGITGFLISHKVLFPDDQGADADPFLKAHVELFLHGLER